MNSFPNKHPEVIEAAGGLVWLDSNEGRKIVILHRPKYDDWTLPKGKREPGEAWHETALREVYEETGCRARIDTFAGGVIYIVNNVPKVVLFWSMSIIRNDRFIPNKEIDKCKWVLPKDAMTILSYDGEKTLLEQFL
jgi:8-oxo-dGTP diphosphatase